MGRIPQSVARKQGYLRVTPMRLPELSEGVIPVQETEQQATIGDPRPADRKVLASAHDLHMLKVNVNKRRMHPSNKYPRRKS